MDTHLPLPGSAPDDIQEGFDRIRAALRGVRFGEVTVVIKYGQVVEVERTERFRVVRRRAREDSP